MVQYCVVPLCKANAFTPGVSFHSFPQDKYLRKQWIVKIKRDVKRNVKISNSMRVCSRHFKLEDIIPSKNGKMKILRRGAVPILFDFDSQKQVKHRRKLTWLEISSSVSLFTFFFCNISFINV